MAWQGTSGEKADAGRTRRLRPAWGFAAGFAVVLAAWLGNVSTAGTRVEGCPQACVTGHGRQDGPLRVMSLNVLHGYPTFAQLSQRLDLIAGTIRRHDADIVFLQEVPWTRRLGSGAQYLGERTGLNYLYLRANGNRHAILFEEGLVILSRFALQAPRFVELAPQASVFEHRVALHATALTPWGAVRVFVTHLTHRDATINRAQTAALQTFVQQTGSGLALIAGDLNATEDTPQIQALSPEWIDVYRAANPEAPGLTCCITDLASHPSTALKKRIDYMFLASPTTLGAHVLSTRRILAQPFPVAQGWQWASDHTGLLTEIQLEQRVARTW